MYEMYDWDRADTAAGSRQRPASGTADRLADRRFGLTPAARALQIALDRRDNGGEAAAAQAE